MKTAQEMFEEIGYKRASSERDIYYSRKDVDVIFYESSKHYSCKKWVEIECPECERIEEDVEEYKLVSIKLHQATTKQMKELGWI